MSNEILVIVTRREGLTDEFRYYFPNGDTCSQVCKTNNSVCEYEASLQCNKIKVIFFNGMLADCSKKIKDFFQAYCNDPNIRIFLLVHGLKYGTLDKALTALFNANIPNMLCNIQYANYSASIGFINVVEALAKAMKNNNCETINSLISEIKDYILKKKANPHLIALSILCQGYLAAHGNIELPKGISISEEKKKLTVGKGWWSPVFSEHELGREFRDTEIYKELSASRCDSSKIQDFFVKIKEINNGNGLDINIIEPTYSALKIILQGK